MGVAVVGLLPDMGTRAVPSDSYLRTHRSIPRAFFGQSKTTAYSELLKGTDLKEATCDKYYGNYFKVLSIEKQAKDADPDLEYGGFCSLEFLGFVQAMFIFQGMLWIVLLVATAPRLLRKLAEVGKSVEGGVREVRATEV